MSTLVDVWIYHLHSVRLCAKFCLPKRTLSEMMIATILNCRWKYERILLLQEKFENQAELYPSRFDSALRILLSKASDVKTL